MDVNIREIRGEESLKYRELRARGLADHPEAFGETSEHFAAKSPAVIEAQLEARRADGGFTLGAFVGDQLVGTVALIRDEGEKFHHRGMLIGMYVHPDFRGQSISARLIDELLTRARMVERLEQVYLAVTTVNAAAIQLYHRYGFQTYGVVPKASKIGGVYHDEYLMVRHLHESSSDTVEQELEKLELSLLDPHVRASADKINELIADDFEEMGAAGSKFGKSDVLEHLPRERGVRWSASDVKVRLLAPQAALVTYTACKSVDGVPVGGGALRGVRFGFTGRRGGRCFIIRGRV